MTLHIHASKGSLLSTNRHRLVLNALKTDAEYMLWLDSDMKFPPDLLFRLLRWRKDIVGCNYPQKKFPSHPTAFLAQEEIKKLFPDKYETMGNRVALKTVPGQTGLAKCSFLGFGALLMKTDCFRKVPPPWFDITWQADTDNYEGEDVCCLRRMQEAGYEVWCDLETSNLVSHIGDFEYVHDLVGEIDGPGNGNESNRLDGDEPDSDRSKVTG